MSIPSVNIGLCLVALLNASILLGEQPKAKSGLLSGDPISIGGLRINELPPNLELDGIVAREVDLLIAGDSHQLTETYLLACRFHECGSRRCLIQINRRPYSEKRFLRSFREEPPKLTDSELGFLEISQVWKRGKPWDEQSKAFKEYVSRAGLSGEFSGEIQAKHPAYRILLKEANLDYLKDEWLVENFKKSGYTMVPSESLPLSKSIKGK